jgi:hypothetical protein
MKTEHYSTDVPKLTRIIEPKEHAGKLIIDVKVTLRSESKTTIACDDGTIFDMPTNRTLIVEHGPERQAKMEWARNLLS